MTKKGKEKLLTSDSGPNEENIKAHWTVVTKELFIDLALEQVNTENRPGKGFNKKDWENIIAGFKSKTSLTYDQSQFKNLYDKLRASW